MPYLPWYYLYISFIYCTCWVPTISVLNLAILPCYSNLLLRTRRWTGILWRGVLGYTLPRLPFLWCYGVFRCSVSLRVVLVFKDIIYVIIIFYIHVIWLSVSAFGHMCRTIDPGSCIWWVPSFGIKPGMTNHLRRVKNEIYIKANNSMEKGKWDCLDMILSQSWTPKTWATLPTFYPLLIWLYLLNGLEVMEFQKSTSLLNSVLDRTVAEWNSTFGSRIGRNSGSPEYHYSMQLSQISDSPLNGPNSWWFTSYGCWKLDRSAESEILWTDCTFRH
jgi:hypothetical protein